MPYKLDKNGVPILDLEDIEKKAEEVILHFIPETMEKPQITPIAIICQKLHDNHSIEFYFKEDLGISDKGKKVIGKFRSKPKSIFIDAALDYNSPRWNFVLAHELGHLAFHKDICQSQENKNTEIEDSDDEINPMEAKPESIYFWTEWQANKFASCLLMPRITFAMVAKKEIRKLNLSRHRDKIYLDDQPVNRNSLYLALASLREIYQTSKQATTIRMKELGFVIDKRNPRRLFK